MNRKLYLSLVFFGLFCSSLEAQDGDLYLYNYEIPIKNIDNQNLSATQGNNGLMYFANKKGILSYDGVSWELIRTTSTPYTLANNPAQNGKIYIGGRESIGFLIKDRTGKEKYQSIELKEKNFGEITKIHIEGDRGYFYSDRILFKINLSNDQVEQVWRSKKEQLFMGFAFLNGQLFLNFKGKGLHRVTDKGFKKVEKSSIYSFLKIVDFVAFDQNRVLLNMGNNWNYLFDGQKLQIYLPVAKKYIEGNVIKNALKLPNDHIAIGTLSGGVVIINPSNYSTDAILNFQTGLPDDEIFAMCTDSQGGLWVCHAKGISRADMRLPIHLFSGYAGLEGNIETLLIKSDTLYVASSDGLYFLSRVERYEEIESLIRKEQKYWKTVETVSTTVKIKEPKQRSRLRRLRHSQDGKKLEKRKIIVEEEVKQKRVPVQTYGTEVSTLLFKTKEARKAYALQSIPYIFKEINGLNAKCRQLIHFNGRIIASTNLGLYEIVRTKGRIYAKQILPKVYINFIHQSSRNAQQMYVCTDKGLIILKNDKGYWQKTYNNQDSLNTAIYSLIENDNQIWLGAESQVFKLEMDEEGKVLTTKQYTFEESYAEDVLVRVLKGKPAFLLSAGIYSYSAKKDTIYKDPRLQKYFNPRSNILYNQAGFTWIKNSSWQNISHPTNTDFLKTNYFEFFNNIQEVYVDEAQNIWILNNNELYKISSEAQTEKQEEFKVFIKNIINKPDELVPLDKIIFDYEQQGHSFTFRLASPFYRSERSIEYQYWLEGLSKEWSDWDTKAIISFPYVPTGEYKLHVRARNIFEQTSEEQVYEFKIEPPFWETYWFYFLQISILFGLLLFSFLFRRAGKYSTLSYILTFVSIITVFEFFILLLEPYVENFSNGIPIFKLGMNILLAISLSPIERLLKVWLEKKPKRTSVEEPIESKREAEALREEG